MQLGFHNFLVLIIFGLLIVIPASANQSRIALVVGNAAYPSSPLRNPANDAVDVSATFIGLGFEVIHLENATFLEMEKAVRKFGDLLKRSNGIGIFFYAGHGLQVNGRNYLIPVDADIQDETEVRHKALDVDFVMGKMELAKNNVNLLILDACRNNPFERRFRSGMGRGLAQMTAPRGTVIWYATRPGKVALDGDGRNSPFTHHLVQALKEPYMEARKIISQIAIEMYDAGFEQEPWQEGIWLKDFYFTDGSKIVKENKPPPVITSKADSKITEKAKVAPIKKPKIESLKEPVKVTKPIEKTEQEAVVSKVETKKEDKSVIKEPKQTKEEANQGKISLPGIALFSKKKKLTLIDSFEETREILLNYNWDCTWRDQYYQGTSKLIFESTEQDVFIAKIKHSTCPEGWGVFSGKLKKGSFTGNTYQFPNPCQGGAHIRSKLYSSAEGGYQIKSTYSPTNYQAKGEQICVALPKL